MPCFDFSKRDKGPSGTLQAITRKADRALQVQARDSGSFKDQRLVISRPIDTRAVIVLYHAVGVVVIAVLA